MIWRVAVPMPWPLLDFPPQAWTRHLPPVSGTDAAMKHPRDSSGATLGTPHARLLPVPVPASPVPSAWLSACPRFPGCES